MKGTSAAPALHPVPLSLPEEGVALTDVEVAKISDVAAEVMRLTARGVNVFLHMGQIVVIRVHSPHDTDFVDAFDVVPRAGIDLLARCNLWLDKLARVERDLAG